MVLKPENSVIETIKILEQKKLGKQVNFRLKDWGISRQHIGMSYPNSI